MMTRTSASGRNETFCYYKCNRKHRTANTACSTRDVRADKVEKFVIAFLRDRAIDPAAIKKAVGEANGGRDGALAEIERELQEKRTNHLQASKTLAILIDALEADAADVQALMVRIRDREKIVEQLKAEIGALEARPDAFGAETLDAEVVAEAYTQLPDLLAKAEREGALKSEGAAPGVVEVLEWRQDAADTQKGGGGHRAVPATRLLGR